MAWLRRWLWVAADRLLGGEQLARCVLVAGLSGMVFGGGHSPWPPCPLGGGCAGLHHAVPWRRLSRHVGGPRAGGSDAEGGAQPGAGCPGRSGQRPPCGQGCGGPCERGRSTGGQHRRQARLPVFWQVLQPCGAPPMVADFRDELTRLEQWKQPWQGGCWYTQADSRRDMHPLASLALALAPTWEWAAVQSCSLCCRR